MAPSVPITVYSAKICPWAQRVTLALREVGAYANNQVKHVEIDLQNKPADYAQRVNPASKVPVIVVGEEGAPGTLNIPESGVLLELVAELWSESGLSPEDPVKRAYARFFSQRYQDVVNGPYSQVLYQGKTEAAPSLLTGIEEIQSLLAKHNGTFLLGDKPSIGDLAVAPFGVFSKLSSDEKYAPFRAYHEALVSRPSWSETFDEEYIVEKMTARIKQMREQQKL
uniref:BY PROTMAP: gi/472580701/gb/EMS18479.1/ maleylacetoacetate isomerase [Rhodosporidium toruloides NP11] gi/647402927/emb/CDR49115.1/ RHTO0S23e00936g1_1 [Rhodosporidium toruloides] n=1 Tax=Rhodotorula toruloides TaxID=5286 RepID=A0A0K3C5T7_RHOTO